MKMKNIILLLLLFFICKISVSQNYIVKDTLFFDENNIQMNRALGIKKCHSKVFYCREMEYDSIITYNAYFKYFFDKLKEKEYKQYVSILKNRMNIDVDLNSTIVINYSRINSKYLKYVRRPTSSPNKYEEKRSKNKKKLIITNYTRQYKKHRKKCLRKLKKVDNTVPAYIYSKQNKSKLDSSVYNKFDKNVFQWVKDYQDIFRNKFFNDGNKFTLLVLKPNGNYFLKNGKTTPYDLGDDEIYKLVKDKSWVSHHNKWNRRLINMPKAIEYIRVGNNIESMLFNPNCF